MDIRRIVVIDEEIQRESGRPVEPPTRRVAACAVLANPLAGRPAQDDLDEMVELSVEVGTILTRRALWALGDLRPTGYGKAVVVGTNGDLEHGAAMIHVRMGLAMRREIGGGKALIPGLAKVAGPGTPVDMAFCDRDDAWVYDRMDAMEVCVPGAPKPDEILLIVGLEAGNRPNARVQGPNPAQAAAAAGGRKK